MKLSVEMGDVNSRDYGTVHATGCRKMRDDMPMGEATTFANARALFLDSTGWELDDDEQPTYAPCARKGLR